jgi:hypothetical protein
MDAVRNTGNHKGITEHYLSNEAVYENIQHTAGFERIGKKITT